jgi:hypothetical protein
MPTSGRTQMATALKMVRVLAVIMGVLLIILSFARVFPLGNEALILAAFILTVWGLEVI